MPLFPYGFDEKPARPTWDRVGRLHRGARSGGGARAARVGTGGTGASVVREGLKAMRVNQPACGHQPFLGLKAMAS